MYAVVVDVRHELHVPGLCLQLMIMKETAGRRQRLEQRAGASGPDGVFKGYNWLCCFMHSQLRANSDHAANKMLHMYVRINA